MNYTFGTDIINEKRLKNMAGFFNPAAKSFIKRYLDNDIHTVIDLGCGPGFTTKMLSEIIDCNTLIGLDNSENYIKSARMNYTHLKFYLHDVTKTPFPVKADILYCRFLLSHLSGVLSVVNKWIKELNQNGKILIDEVEDVITRKAVFKRYLTINDALVNSRGAQLFIGKALSTMKFKGRVIHNTCDILPVSNRRAASWFYSNAISIWEKEGYVLNTVLEDERKKISCELKEIMESEDMKSDIIWHMRRMVIQR
ncbi:MAG: class I SAM-dependent methyltransferase [Spirochaetales bacterium]|nr:class I SAM-dependent methyltransferase [Spirochaetales bacterium]